MAGIMHGRDERDWMEWPFFGIKILKLIVVTPARRKVLMERWPVLRAT
jgi:hypothetical protein